MFTHIFIYEIKHQLRQPANWFFALLIFLLAFVPLTEMASEPPARFSNRIVNSPAFLWSATKKLMLLAFLLIPIVMGNVLQRDTQSQMHQILYSYPFRKWEYVLAKFVAGFSIYTLIISMLGVGFAIGISMPWANPALVTDFQISTYLYLYSVLLLPTCFFLSILAFSIVLLSRNLYAGFVSVFLMLLLNMIPSAIFTGESAAEWVALVAPFGGKAVGFYTQNWTVAEQNVNALPLGNLIIFNRLIWVGLAALIFIFAGKIFRLNQTASVWLKRKKSAKKSTVFQTHFIHSIQLTEVRYDYSIRQQLRSIWRLSQLEFIPIVTGRLFISLTFIGLVFIIVILSLSNSPYGAETYPMTWQMLSLPSVFFSGVIATITFLYAGLLLRRERMANMHQLVDATAVENHVLLGVKFLTLIKVQIVLLTLVMLGGIAFQISRGFFDFDLPQYFFYLYVILLIHFIIWGMLAFFIQSLFKNSYVGFILLCLAPLGFATIGEIGSQHLGVLFLEQIQFRYNQAPGSIFGLQYSDLDGYGADLLPYFTYKIYWSVFGLLFLVGTYLLWSRGLAQTWRERLQTVKTRFNRPIALLTLIIGFAFLSLGTAIYHENNVANTYFTRGERNVALRLADKKYARYEHFIQPKIVDVKVAMDIFPAQRQFKAKGEYLIINQSDQAIDTLIINYLPDLNTTYSIYKIGEGSESNSLIYVSDTSEVSDTWGYLFSKRKDSAVNVVKKDTITDLFHFDILKLKTPLAAGDSLRMQFQNGNHPQGMIRTNDFVKNNGTYIEDDIFPRLGNWLSFARQHHDMGEHSHHPHPADSTVHQHSFIARDADQVTFQATVSTAADQIAISNGKLQREWIEKGRRYFHYQMNRPMPLAYIFTSGKYTVQRDRWQDIDLEVYYHPDHNYNIDRILAGMKASLNYCSKHFSPYQFDHLRMVEFSQINGATAHGFPGTIPAGEGSGFIANVDDTNDAENDYAFGMAAHEVAHQWWGNQVIPADTRGAKMVVESLAEYVNVMVKKHYKNEAQAHHFIKNNLEGYLGYRSRLRRAESPLALSYPKENYLHYPKGAVALHSLAIYLGEENLNQIIKNYVAKVAFQTETYTTSLELVEMLKTQTPDSLRYLIHDWLETVTLYNNKISQWESKELANGQHEITIDFLISKYRSTENGKQHYSDNGRDSLSYQDSELLHSLPLRDYVEIGVYDEEDELLVLEKILVQQIDNQLVTTTKKRPHRVVVDPNYLLADTDLRDNQQ